MNERQEERLEPSLEREGAGGGLKPLLKEQEGVGVDGDPRASPAKIRRLRPQNQLGFARKNRSWASPNANPLGEAQQQKKHFRFP